MKYRVSNVEAFRAWEADPDADEEALSALIASIRGESQPSARMLAGTAFHKALELAPTGISADEIAAEGYTFRFVGDFDVRLCAVRELRASRTYTADGWPIVISGQVDQIAGRRIEDHKTTGRFDAERYLTGYQWRLYLDIFGADHFRWNVFEIAETDDPMTWEVTEQHTLEQFRYPGMAADCEALVQRFARFVRSYVEERAAA